MIVFLVFFIQIILFLVTFNITKRKTKLLIITSSQIDLQWFSDVDEESKTEEPSDYKIRKAREEGRVAKSQDLNSSLLLLLSFLTLIAFAPSMLNTFIELLQFFYLKVDQNSFNKSLAGVCLQFFLRLSLPVIFTALIAGVASNILQNGGFIFSVKPITPQINKISPNVFRFFSKAIFSAEGMFNVAKSLGKVIVVAIVAFLTIKKEIPKLISMLNTSLPMAVFYVASLVSKIVLTIGIIFLIIAIPDYIFQRFQYRKSLKMTKEEVKEEYKHMEGDPLIKGRLKQRMQEMLTQNMAVNVPNADVIITNPTHYAVAMQWDRLTMSAPMLTAKGIDNLALRIKTIAKENEVPIVENKPLARALYAEVEIGDIIPDEYYQALALILAKVYSLDSRKSKILQDI